MKKNIRLLAIAGILMTLTTCLMTLTACRTDKDDVEQEEQARYETSGSEKEIGELDLETSQDEREDSFMGHVYQPSKMLYKEPLSEKSFQENMEKTQTGYAVYYFDLSISEQERDVCITATDRIISCIDAALPDVEIVVFRSEMYDGLWVSGHRLYLSPQDWDSADYLAKVLLAGYGEWGNYGLAYGYAEYLCQKAGMDGSVMNSAERLLEDQPEKQPIDQETKFFQKMSASEAYDLNLLCFDERFVSPEDAEAARNNACLFVKEYLSVRSEEEFLALLSASGTLEGVAQANEALETFYAENGVDCGLTGMRYQYGGIYSDYGVASEYAYFYVGKDWENLFWEMHSMVSENFLHENYREIRDFFECCVQQMWQYQELFHFDSYNNTLAVYFKNRTTALEVSYYIGPEHTIYLESVASLMHEYIHSLMFGHCDWEYNWKNEGFATYFANKYNLYMYDYWNYVWNNSDSILWIREYIDALGRPVDVRTDFREMDDLTVHAYGLTDPNSAYQSGSSFIGYLAEQYGEQAVIDYVCSDDEYNEEWDKSYSELVQDWNQYIEEHYGQYNRIGVEG